MCRACSDLHEDLLVKTLILNHFGRLLDKLDDEFGIPVLLIRREGLGELHFLCHFYVASLSLLTAELGDHPQYAKADIEGGTLCLHFTHGYG